MHVHQVPGSWLAHPFWRGSFKLADARQLAQLKSAVAHVVIDTSKGLDVEAVPPSAPQTAYLDDVEVQDATGLEPPAELELHTEGGAREARASFQDEVVRASRIVAQSRGAMQSMFQDVRLGKAVDAEHCLPLVDRK